MPIEAQRLELVHAEKGNMFLGIRFGWIERIIEEIEYEPISARRRNIGKQTKKGLMHCPIKKEQIEPRRCLLWMITITITIDYSMNQLID